MPSFPIGSEGIVDRGVNDDKIIPFHQSSQGRGQKTL